MGERLGVCVIIRKSRKLVLKGKEPRSSDDTCLAHAAAKRLAQALRTVDERARAGEDRPNRRAEAFAQTERDRVSASNEVGNRRVRCDTCVRKPRAVDVKLQARVGAQRLDIADERQRQHAAAARIVRVLERHEPRARVVRVVGTHGVRDVRKLNRPVRLVWDRVEPYAHVRCCQVCVRVHRSKCTVSRCVFCKYGCSER